MSSQDISSGFVIPKKGVQQILKPLTEDSLGQADRKLILDEINKSVFCKGSTPPRTGYEIVDMNHVSNSTLDLEYIKAKKLYIEKLRSTTHNMKVNELKKKIKELTVFNIVESEEEMLEIVNNGFTCKQSDLPVKNVLCSSEYGIHVIRHMDIGLKYCYSQKMNSFYVIASKIFYMPELMVCTHTDYETNASEYPSNNGFRFPNVLPNETQPIVNRFYNSMIYVFEVDLDGDIIFQPKNILPWAVLKYKRIDPNTFDESIYNPNAIKPPMMMRRAIKTPRPVHRTNRNQNLVQPHQVTTQQNQQQQKAALMPRPKEINNIQPGLVRRPQPKPLMPPSKQSWQQNQQFRFINKIEPQQPNLNSIINNNDNAGMSYDETSYVHRRPKPRSDSDNSDNDVKMKIEEDEDDYSDPNEMEIEKEIRRRRKLQKQGLLPPSSESSASSSEESEPENEKERKDREVYVMYRHVYADNLQKMYTKPPKWRIMYERTGQLDVVFRGERQMRVNLDDVRKTNLRFADEKKTRLDVNNITNNLLLTYLNKKTTNASKKPTSHVSISNSAMQSIAMTSRQAEELSLRQEAANFGQESSFSAPKPAQKPLNITNNPRRSIISLACLNAPTVITPNPLTKNATASTSANLATAVNTNENKTTDDPELAAAQQRLRLLLEKRKKERDEKLMRQNKKQQ